ncbi:tetratricopeptide repeat protein [Plastoroseomonas arctica]|uniref:protein O-GlcNAc transferase n=1 Tax=Plastoroseomonas arctica TaxID=1509237 RepID=A0AAF1K5X9_9PROT|nr:tetratricopeptide repeat protein [Plastoroseomonas arctica]MBR0657080.1 tetratricopeptide repeat protein [Plastoroseomonas arctica]
MTPLESAEAAARARPGDPMAQAKLAELLLRAGQPEPALKAAERALKREPVNPRHHMLAGGALTMLRRHQDALAHFARAQKLAPSLRDPLVALCGSRQALGQNEAVLADAALLHQVLGPEAGIVLGRSAMALRRPAIAIEEMTRVLAVEPHAFAAWVLKGDAEAMAGQREAAAASYEGALRLAPRDGALLVKRGKALQALGRDHEAIRHFDAAVDLDPGDARAWFHRGLSLTALDQPAEAAKSYRRALDHAPRNVNAWNNLGAAYEEMQCHGLALDTYATALAIAPDDDVALGNHGRVAARLGRHALGQASLGRLLELQPGNAGARFLLAESRLFSDDFAGAIAEFSGLLDQHPEHPYALGGLLHAHQRGCLWQGMDAIAQAAIAATALDRLASQPFYLMAATDDPATHLAGARIWLGTEDAGTGPLAAPAITGSGDGGRIRLAYISPDFGDHPVSLLTVGLFEAHDRDRFEVTGVMIGPLTQSPMAERVTRSFDHYIDAWEMRDEALVGALRTAGIDIAIDLAGFTTHSRSRLFVLRAAPVQVNFLGISGSIGVPTHDYVVVDPVVAPHGAEAHFAEKLLRLPHCYMPNDRQRAIAEHCPPRAAYGLPEHGLVFAAFNLAFKITPEVFSAWCRLLDATPGSVLWLAALPATAAANLRAEAAARGIDPARLVFAERVPYPEHLARLALADLALDTFPYTGATTASDALWAGLPLLTIAGRAFNARVAASLLHTVGLAELVTSDLADYEATALALARDPARLAALRARLAANRLATPLFDTAGYTRALEAGFTAIHARNRAGQPPEHITLPA